MKTKRLLNTVIAAIMGMSISAQTTFPVNGVADPRTGYFAFTHATIIKDATTKLEDATLIIREGKIISVGKGKAPDDAVTIDCQGKTIYPSLIDIYSDYGLPAVQRPTGGFSFFGPQQFTSNNKGPVGWNQAVKSEFDAVSIFSSDAARAKQLREQGFGTVVSHQKDGIARGTGFLVTLSGEKENLSVIREKAAAFYSFSKGSSTQTYPSSMMGSVALLRQTFLDADWYLKNKPAKEGINKTLEAWNNSKGLPWIFESSDKWTDIRADRIGDEFGVQFIIRGGGDEYQRIKEIAKTKAPFILNLNFPETQNVEDPADARYVSLGDMKHWELAPGNAAALEKASIEFAITSADLKDLKSFRANLRKAIDYGLTEKTALEALTKTPATLLKVYDKVGSLEAGKLANFLITDGNLFETKTHILENWVQGKRFDTDSRLTASATGKYKLTIQGNSGTSTYVLELKDNNQARILAKDTVTAKFKKEDKLITISFAPGSGGKPTTPTPKEPGRNAPKEFAMIRLSGADYGIPWQGIGQDTTGQPVTWTAEKQTVEAASKDQKDRKTLLPQAKITYPFGNYGNETLPLPENILFRNATVITNEKEGTLSQTDVLIRNGKIVQIGKNIPATGARVIDATGKYLSPGIIDEHSHIAAFSINEGAHSVTSEVRIGDNLNPEDINIYRQLSGGVTTSHILHGSANTIGGQTQLIKLRWGADDEGLKFAGADSFIKFALGENVKRTAQPAGNARFPDTRMGVEEVLADAFQRTTDYDRAIKEGRKDVRKDLQLDALVEILNKKRFITCHSYVQSEILALINVAEKYGFKVNTFTHILEGYKVADRMKQHGSNVSTFSDWWAYKTEVQDAIAYNAAIMQKVGLNVCINSDDPEMARRLNQEAAKTIKYGDVNPDDAFKMVTLNPATALHISDKVGSVRVGKDADLVLWSGHPLSIYSKALYTLVDGTVYFDREKDAKMRKEIAAERNRLIQKMISDAKSGSPTVSARPTPQVVLHCEDHEHTKGILETDSFEDRF
jgi:imidazolonepropionase-like amidohydrolase